MKQSPIPAAPNSVTPGNAQIPRGPQTGENPLLLVHKLLRGRYILAIVLAFLLGPTGAVLGYFGLQMEYTSNATLRIAPVLPKVLFESEQSNMMPMFDSYVETQVSLIRSRRIIDMAMQSNTWREAGGEYSTELLTEFTENLSVLQPKRSQLIVVGFTDKVPLRARAGTKSVIDSYMSVYGEADLVTETQRFQLLEERAKSLSTQIEGIMSQIMQVANEFGSDDLSTVYSYEMQGLQTLQTELEAAKLQLATLETVGEEEVAPDSFDPSTLTVEEIAAFDTRMQQLVDERKNLQHKIDTFKATLTHPEKSPEYRLALDRLRTQKTEIDTYERLFRENATRSQGASGATTAGVFGPSVTPEQVRIKVDRLQELYDEAKLKTLDLGRKNLQLKNLRADMARLQDSLNLTNTRIEQLSLESSVSGRITVLSEAEMPTSAANAKRRIQFTILGGLAGGGLGVGLVLLLGLLNLKIRDIKDAENIPPELLGVLPELPEQLTDPAQAIMAAQCVHQIRTLLQAHMPQQEAMALTITGAKSNTGKTSLALSLGLSFASAGTRTLIIDGDVVGAGLTRRTKAVGRRKIGHVFRGHDIISEAEYKHALELAQQSGQQVGESLLELGYISEKDLEEGLAIQQDAGLGLNEALAGEDIDDCLADIDVPNLTILPVSSEMQVVGMSPASVSALLDKLRSSYEVILIDAGPVPGPTDAAIMATCADGVILVTSRGDKSSEVQRALNYLEQLNISVAGLIFNRAQSQDITRSGHSSAVSTTSKPSAAKPATGEALSDLEEHLIDCANFGPLPQSVWLSTMRPDVLKQNGGKV